MNIIAKLTLAQIKGSRRRFLVTVLGVILSAAMVTAVLVGADSCMEMLRRVCIGYSGEYHWQGANLPAEGWAQLADDEHFDRVGALRFDGSADLLEPGSALPGDRTRPARQVVVQRVSSDLWSIMQSQLAEGGWPQAPDEAVIPENLARIGGYAVGDSITLLYSGTETPRAYRICGILRYSVLTAASADEATEGVYQMFLPLDSQTAAQPCPDGQLRRLEVYAAAAHLNEEFVAWCSGRLIQTLQGQWPDAYGFLNASLLQYSGVDSGSAFSRIVNGLRGLMLGIIAAASVLLIVNSFSISLAERRRTLGMLASAGATRAQKQAFILYEALLVGVVSIPLGLLAGCAGLAVTFRLVDPLVQSLPLLHQALPGSGQLLRLVVRPQWLALAAAASAAILLLSAWLPARRAAGVSAIDAIRGAGTVRVSVSRRRLQGGRLFGRLFGPEGILAQKNAKRSYRRYLTTLVSLILSIVLLLSASGLALYLEKSYRMAHGNSDYQVQAVVYTDLQNSPEDVAPLLQRLAGPDTPVTSVRTTEEILWGYAAIPREMLTARQAQLMETQGGDLFDSNAQSLITEATEAMAPHILVLTDEEFSQWAGYSLTPRGDTLECVLINSYVYARENHYAEVTPTVCRAGDTLEWQFNTMPVTLHLAGVADARTGADYVPAWGNPRQLQFVTSKSAADAVFEHFYSRYGEYCPRRYLLYYRTGDALELETELNGLENDAGCLVYVQNQEQAIAQITAILALMRVVLYGFVTLIGLVCAANISNTVSTGLALRRRELAMLQSVGLPPEGLRKMILLESMVYAVKALAWGLPISLAVLWKEYTVLRNALAFRFTLPWGAVAAAVAGVFLLTAAAALPTVRALEHSTLVENLRQDADS